MSKCRTYSFASDSRAPLSSTPVFGYKTSLGMSSVAANALDAIRVGLRWSVVPIDGSDDAKSALDRITIPQDVLDRVAPTALPRSSIIISDEPLSAETNYRTEFVAVLSNHPQGGFITRERSSDIMMAADDPRDDGYDPFFRDRRSRGGSYNQNNQYQYNRLYQQPFPFWR